MRCWLGGLFRLLLLMRDDDTKSPLPQDGGIPRGSHNCFRKIIFQHQSLRGLPPRGHTDWDLLIGLTSNFTCSGKCRGLQALSNVVMLAPGQQLKTQQATKFCTGLSLPANHWVRNFVTSTLLLGPGVYPASSKQQNPAWIHEGFVCIIH